MKSLCSGQARPGQAILTDVATRCQYVARKILFKEPHHVLKPSYPSFPAAEIIVAYKHAQLQNTSIIILYVFV